MKNKIDLTDQELIKLLAEDATQSNEVIAKKLRVTAATVRRRKNELRNEGVLRIVGAVDPKKVGYGLTAIIAFDIEHDKLENALGILSRHPELTFVSTTTGRYDAIALGRFQSSDDLSDFLTKTVSNVDGVQNSETFICLHPTKGKYSVMFTSIADTAREAPEIS